MPRQNPACRHIFALAFACGQFREQRQQFIALLRVQAIQRDIGWLEAFAPCPFRIDDLMAIEHDMDIGYRTRILLYAGLPVQITGRDKDFTLSEQQLGMISAKQHPVPR